jgi:curli biogenesis system outer membrane secretion channel CsgG
VKTKQLVAVSAVALVLAVAIPWTRRASADMPAGEWKPYLSDKKGETQPFPEPPAKMKDKEWLQVQYSAFAGFKPRLGVVLSQEKRGTGNDYSSEWIRLLSDMYGKPEGGTNPFNHIEDLVRQALFATNRFTMVERTTALEDVTGEQDFGASGRVDKKTAAKIGRMKGSDYVVKATIIELNPNKESKSIGAVAGGAGATTLGIGSIGVTGKVAFCRLNVRLVNATTGEIVQDMTVDGTASGSGLTIGAGLIKAATKGTYGGAGGISTKKAPALSDAMQACANKIAYYTAMKFEDLPWEGAVASVSGSKVIINAGSNVGLKEGLVLKLLAKGEAIVDPDDASNILGYDTQELGSLRIVNVQDRFSTCEIIEGGSKVKKGDIVRLEVRKK